jgi:hypothetical protein
MQVGLTSAQRGGSSSRHARPESLTEVARDRETQRDKNHTSLSMRRRLLPVQYPVTLARSRAASGESSQASSV